MLDNRTMMSVPEIPPILKEKVTKWLEEGDQQWERKVSSFEGGNAQDGSSIWDDMPVIDSKLVAEMSYIFEEFYGLPLDSRIIRPGGYRDIDDLLTDIVPKMTEKRKLSEKLMKQKGGN